MSRILIVEDTDAITQLYRTVLTEAGHEVESCVTAYATVRAVLLRKFDLILMDLLIEGADGVVTTIALRGIGFTGPVVAITGGLMPIDDSMERAAGFAMRLLKPFVKVDDLVTLVEKLVQEKNEDENQSGDH